MINKNKSYSKYSFFLKENNLSKKEIKDSQIYKYLINNLNFVENENLWINNITSMSMQKDPKKIRLRNDKFLQSIYDKNITSCLISGIKIDEQKLFLVYFNKSFYGYNHSKNSSNSFITFDSIEELEKYCSLKSDNIQTRNVREKTKFLFYTNIENSFDANKFELFVSLIKDADFNPYNPKGPLNNYDPQIPNETKTNVPKIYENICSLYHSDFICASGIEWDKIINDGSLIELHHFIPKKYFRNKIGLVDWEIIHNEINIVPLCSFCHKSIHSSKEEKYKNTFDNIINTYKKSNRYDRFIDFMITNTDFKNTEELLNFYKNKKLSK